MARIFHAYIDEAGDEGFGKLRQPDRGGQSTWLMLGAIITSGDHERDLPGWRDEIADGFVHKRRRDLHFQRLNHDQRVFACRLLARRPLGICVVASDKRTLPALADTALAAFKRKGHLYNYLVRLLLERVSDACARKAGGQTARLQVTFSRRGGTDYEVMHDYLCRLRDAQSGRRTAHSINWDVLSPDDIRVMDHSNRAGLQLADLVTSATYKAFEPNMFGDVEDRYLRTLKPRFIHDGMTTLNYGLTVVPGDSASFQERSDILRLFA